MTPGVIAGIHPVFSWKSIRTSILDLSPGYWRFQDMKQMKQCICEIKGHLHYTGKYDICPLFEPWKSNKSFAKTTGVSGKQRRTSEKISWWFWWLMAIQTGTHTPENWYGTQTWRFARLFPLQNRRFSNSMLIFPGVVTQSKHRFFPHCHRGHI